ncbi:MAG TPA: MlaD family protein [Solirubrobacterales bacterium]|nr:MlaD family protein [Solirubrobacterales bacterium]
MRRLFFIAALVCASVAALAASAAGDDERTYYIEFDNAFGLTDGSEVKVAGVAAGTVTDLDVNSSKRAVVAVELSGPLAVLGEDTICRSEPQSLIAEYFIDCSPRGAPIEIPDLSEAERIEHPDIPVAQTRQTVQNDLVLNTLRMPYRERLAILINEFGTALAGNGENLNDAIRRGAPALEQTRKVTRLLAGQNETIRDLNVNADRIIGRLAERRRDVVRFIEEAKGTAEAAAVRRDDLSRNFALLDDFLAELGPTMTRLDQLAVEGTPLAADLRRAAPGLTTLARNLPAFNRSATIGLQALGNASVTGRRALRRGRGEIRQLAESTKKSYATAEDLSDFLRDIDDPGRAVEVDARAARDTGREAPTGYTGMEGLLNYLYYQTLAINQFDEVGHLLHFSIFEVATGPCSEYNTGAHEGELGVPDADGTGATTNVRDAHRCVAWLGDQQPDINEPLGLPPYDPSVCPDGSTDLSLCNPAGGGAAAAETSRRPATGAPAVPERGDGRDGGDDPATGGSSEPPPGEAPPVLPAPGGAAPLPDIGAALDGDERGSAGDAATGDLLDYLFGS